VREYPWGKSRPANSSDLILMIKRYYAYCYQVVDKVGKAGIILIKNFEVKR
jgi:hypothetical protein